jgi:hypothetical protein
MPVGLEDYCLRVICVLLFLRIFTAERKREQERVEGDEQMGTVRERDETRCSVLLQI